MWQTRVELPVHVTLRSQNFYSFSETALEKPAPYRTAATAMYLESKEPEPPQEKNDLCLLADRCAKPVFGRTDLRGPEFEIY
jgi:hypothetical protein